MNTLSAPIFVAGTIFVAAATLASAQDSPAKQRETPMPISTQWVLDAAAPTQRIAIKSVYLLICRRTDMKGTAFLLKNGILVTDNHVVEGCQSDELEATSPTGRKVTFSKLLVDVDRDLALLRPSEKLDGGLELGTDISPALETPVKTWGFPLTYNGPAPILSAGYVAGYNDARIGNKTVKHIVVNGAFNPGNSGGPLLTGSNKVVGIVVWKMRLLPAWTQQAIVGLRNSNAVTSSGATITLPDGTTRGISQQELISLVLQQFYNTVQVMIGEATSVSELRDFLREKENELK